MRKNPSNYPETAEIKNAIVLVGTMDLGCCTCIKKRQITVKTPLQPEGCAYTFVYRSIT